jgi:hypothetical protein
MAATERDGQAVGGAAPMTSRQWTREELDRVHPLPDGWEWAEILEPNICDQRWCAVYGDDDPGRVSVTVEGFVEVDGEDVPVAVALAVILASQGLDSLAAMADAMAMSDDDECCREDVVDMLRRGRVAL